MESGTYVYCQTRFIGFHSWPNAPESVAFLRNEHRHEFHVKVVAKVDHHDREIEFITLRAQVDDLVKEQYPHWGSHVSCETMAQGIADALHELNIVSVEVSEDGENGAIVVC